MTPRYCIHGNVHGSCPKCEQEQIEHDKDTSAMWADCGGDSGLARQDRIADRAARDEARLDRVRA